ncbi:transcription factor S [archaeon]|jgi:transcription factor S|nr:transcription factor S [archaeon]MBT6761480.1 transcription factor S [archaeon]
MSMFCPECSSILRPKSKGAKKILYCACGYTKDTEGESLVIKEEVEAVKEMEVVNEMALLPKIRTICSKCENNVAYFWTQQTRAADEPETRFFKCAKCSHTWREYS